MPALLRLGIGGHWTASDFSDCLRSINTLYQYQVVIDLAYQDYNEWEKFYLDFPLPPSRLRRYRARQLQHVGFFSGNIVELLLSESENIEQLIAPNEVLTVKKIHYASPGDIDLLGLGKAIKEIRTFLQFIIEYCGNNENRKIDRALKREELRAKRIENARQFVHVLRDIGFSETEIREMIVAVDKSQGTLIDLIADDKLLTVSFQSDTKD